MSTRPRTRVRIGSGYRCVYRRQSGWYEARLLNPLTGRRECLGTFASPELAALFVDQRKSQLYQPDKCFRNFPPLRPCSERLCRRFLSSDDEQTLVTLFVPANWAAQLTAMLRRIVTPNDGGADRASDEWNEAGSPQTQDGRPRGGAKERGAGPATPAPAAPQRRAELERTPQSQLRLPDVSSPPLPALPNVSSPPLPALPDVSSPPLPGRPAEWLEASRSPDRESPPARPALCAPGAAVALWARPRVCDARPPKRLREPAEAALGGVEVGVPLGARRRTACACADADATPRGSPVAGCAQSSDAATSALEGRTAAARAAAASLRRKPSAGAQRLFDDARALAAQIRALGADRALALLQEDIRQGVYGPEAAAWLGIWQSLGR